MTMKALVVKKLTDMFDCAKEDGEDKIWIELLGQEVALDEILALPDEEILDVLLDTCTVY